MVDELAYVWTKGREHLLQGVCSAVRRARDELNSGNAIDTKRIEESFAKQFSKFIEGSDVEWQFRPSIERNEKGRLKDAGFLFDLIWYSVVRKEGLCLFRDVALIAEFELDKRLKLAQHDFLKILGFHSMVKVAIVNCKEADCYNLVSNAVRECRYITGGRYMIWRVNGNRIEQFAEFDLRWENGEKWWKPINGLMFDKDFLNVWTLVGFDELLCHNFSSENPTAHLSGCWMESGMKSV